MKRIFLALALLILSLSPAMAARGFYTTYGTGSSDSISFGLTAWPTNWTLAAYIWINGAGAGNAGRVINGNHGGSQTDYFVDMNSGTGSMKIAVGYSATQAQWTFAAPSTGVWHCLVITRDGSLLTNVPVVYVDATTPSVTLGTAGVGTLSTVLTTTSVGNNTAANRSFDGKIAEAALWNVVFTPNQAAAYCSGASPLRLAPTALVFYAPLTGKETGEVDWGPSHLSGTATGAKIASHPRVGFQPFMNKRQQ